MEELSLSELSLVSGLSKFVLRRMALDQEILYWMRDGRFVFNFRDISHLIVSTSGLQDLETLEQRRLERIFQALEAA